MKAGIYTDLSEREYLATEGWVSASQLKTHLPENFKPFSGSGSADVGSVLHERFTRQGTPVTVVEAATWQGKAAKEAQAAAWAAGQYAILAGDVPAVDGMEKALRAHSEASRLLVDSEGSWELSVFAEVDGVPSKCRFDRLLDDGTAVDIKTTKEQPGAVNLAKAAVNYGYDLARTHYEAVAAAAGIEVTSFLHVFVQNVEPFAVTVVELDEAFMERGRVLRDLALQRYLHPEFVDAYEGQSGVLSVSPPGWARL